MKTFVQIIREAKQSAVKFIADQLSNDENSTDAELILHLAKEVKGANIRKMSLLVKAERTNFLNNTLSHEDAAKLIKKYF